MAAKLQGLVKLPRHAALDDIFNALSKDGGVIIENFVEQDLVDRMNAKIQPYIDKEDIDASLSLDLPDIGDQDESLMAGKTYRIWGLLGKMPDEISTIIQHPIWSGVMEKFLSQDSEDFYGTQMTRSRSSYTLNIANSFTIHPGAERQSFHRDHRTEVTKKNGATMVIRGSHLWGKSQFGLPSEAVPAEMSKGSALIFLGSVFHGAGANTSKPGDPDSVRQLFAVGACRDYYRPDENFLLSTPASVVKNLPENVLMHSGWRRNIAGSGFVEFQDPFDIIDKLPLFAAGKP